MVDHVFVPIHVKEKCHWVLTVISLNDKRINIYNSYRAAGHDANIKTEIVKLAQLIPLKLTMNEYYKNRGIHSSPTQEENEGCDIYIFAYAEYLSYKQEILMGNFDALYLRSRYATLLCNYGQQKNDVRAISDNKAPPRHSRNNVAFEDSETIQIE
ncbi:hypothetical protein R3W88_022803 [Solanum pinnatisectum]|uniref:Ubiquitin-like protease family profile domain-containing protein n=1 Tax=Solanum pinnatisectum TaxID=50273 RepID=A0AAV9LZ30_9SOLN|nr:hypothetical protein R3W88_022803 [Solanum pinnatisectum]